MIRRRAQPAVKVRCLACGAPIDSPQDVVRVAGEHLHARCALYKPRGVSPMPRAEVGR